MTNPLDILKSAILLERKGRAFYQTVAAQTQHHEVKEFFGMMAREEAYHMKVLGEQFKAYKQTGQFSSGSYDKAPLPDSVSTVLTQAVKEKLSGADFESAAISAAVTMEEAAIQLYEGRVQSAKDEEEKKVYQWLADWERTHMNALVNMETELKEKIWNDNQFWPF